MDGLMDGWMIVVVVDAIEPKYVHGKNCQCASTVTHSQSHHVWHTGGVCSLNLQKWH